MWTIKQILISNANMAQDKTKHKKNQTNKQTNKQAE